MMTEEHRTRVQTPGAPKAGGPYSQAIVANGMAYCAGQVAIDPATGQIVEGDIQAQTHRVLQNLEAVLKAAGSSLHHTVKTTVFLAHFSDFAAMNEVYAQYFADPLPARSTIEVGALARGLLVEIECIAVVPRPAPAGGRAIFAPPSEFESTFDLDLDRDI